MKLISTVALILCSQFIFASTTINDSDLSSLESYRVTSDYFRPDSSESTPIRSNEVSIRSFLNKNGASIEIEGLEYELTFSNNIKLISRSSSLVTCEQGSTYRGKVKLVLEDFEIENNRGREYELLFSGECGHVLSLHFDHDSLGGEFFGIWNVAREITKKFSENELSDFISSKIRIRFPSNGDYYNGVVNVTKGYQWDVVGHEIGHAIYSRARIGRSAGGSHRIDECYSSALALSEGWASFFSAWISVDLNDDDAKFEYMVPRRAPLEIEHVPADVCVGPKNEWRVYSFLWDLVDLNNDNEMVSIGFKELWDISAGKMHRDINSFKKALLSSGFDPVVINVVWNQNILNK
mgnify:CR=1 FL=1